MIRWGFGFVPPNETLPVTSPTVDWSIGVGCGAVVVSAGCSAVSSVFLPQAVRKRVNAVAIARERMIRFFIVITFPRPSSGAFTVGAVREPPLRLTEVYAGSPLLRVLQKPDSNCFRSSGSAAAVPEESIRTGSEPRVPPGHRYNP